MQPQPQILTAGIGDVVPILFIVIALISGFLNFLKERKNAGEAQDMRRRKRERKNERDDELSQFLDEVATSDTKPQQRQKRKRPTQRDRSQQRQKRREQTMQSEERLRRSPAKSSSVASRHLDTEEFSQVRDRHVQSSVENRHLESQVSEQHLYESDESSQTATPTATKHPIAQMLARPSGIRDAIILNEILQPPLSRRSRK